MGSLFRLLSRRMMSIEKGSNKATGKALSKGARMSIEKEIGKATWDNYKAPFFKWLERKGKEGAKRYTLLGKMRDAWMKADWGYAEQEYLKYIYEFHSQFHVFGIQGTVKLDELSTDVFLLDKPEFRKYTQSEKTTKTSGLKLVFQDERSQKLFVWGEPGVGKTTFLKQILSYAIEKTDYIPLFISIAEWAATSTLTKEGLLEYLAEQFERCGFSDAGIFIEYIIESGNALLLFDGLDEVSDTQRQYTIQLLKQHKGSKSQIIVTCRVDAVYIDIDEYLEVQVAKWDAKRIQDFIEKRFSNQKLQKKFIEELNDEKKKSLQDFKKNPLLLSLLCQAFDPQKGFPEKRSEIYYEATRHLLLERDQAKEGPVNREIILDKLTLVQKEALYAHLAYNSFNKEQLYFTQKELEIEIDTILTNILGKENSHYVDGSLILPKLIIQHGILSRRGHRTYAFSHLTFQEYYTAKYIAENANNKTLESLTPHINNTRWREIFLLIASLLHEATPLFQAMQKESQNIIASNPRLLTIQSWTIQRANRIPACKENAKRALYWSLSLSLAFAIDRALSFSRAIDPDLGTFHGTFDSLEANNANNSRESHPRDFIHSLDLSLNFARNHSSTSPLIFAVDHALDFNRAHPNHSAYILDRLRSFALDLDPNIAQASHPQAHESFRLFAFDVNTINITALSTIFYHTPEKRIRKHIKKIRDILTAWKKMTINPLDRNKIPRCPYKRKPDKKWQSFRNSVQEIAEKLLEISMMQVWGSEQHKISQIYLENNQLFWECLQIATVDNRKIIEDMILNVPKETL